MAKREPGKLNVGTPPPGTGGYLSAELFKAAAGIDFTIVTYKGTGPLTNDLLGGHVPIAFNVLAPAMGNLQAGTLRAIATAGPARLGPAARRARPSRSPACPASRRCCITA